MRRTFSSAARPNMVSAPSRLVAYFLRRFALAKGESDNEAQQGERLDQGEADVNVGLQRTTGLGLAGDGLHAQTEDDTHTDTGTDDADAVTDDVQAAFHAAFHFFSLLRIVTTGPDGLSCPPGGGTKTVESGIRTAPTGPSALP